ncbi:hypothetical protein [Olivibacter sitiensis]|uniref:hypothetical protein n=1 Tax=Olivibacter sitiensis TaxID=376470 RepID=UPI0012FB07E8|nr:hypothetical protein [Olivibacter sitiensis]
MSTQTITVSPNFRKMALKAIFYIVLFVVTYLLLILLAICLTVLCGYLGIVIITLKVGFITPMLGLGIISMGILVLIFLLKFIFKKHAVDLSHLTESTLFLSPYFIPPKEAKQRCLCNISTELKPTFSNSRS